MGKVAHEVHCVAVLNPDTTRILTERTLAAMQPKAGTTFIQGDSSNLERGFVLPGTVQSQGAFGGFIVCALGSLMDLANFQRKIQILQRLERHRRIRRHRACLKMNFWISSLAASVNTRSGR